jgi:hypothetical protein
LVYAQGMSVVRFLVDRKDKPTFLKFLDRGMSTDWTTAAKDFYDFESIEAMEAAWLTDLIERRKGGDAQPVREPTATSIDRKPAEMSPPPFENQAQVVRAVIDDEGRLVVKALASKPGIKPGPNSGNPMPPPPDSPRQEIVRRFSILDVRGCLVKNHRLDEVELRRFADLLRAERAVIVTYADAPREELENYLLIAQDDTIVLLLPRPRVPTLGGP